MEVDNEDLLSTLVVPVRPSQQGKLSFDFIGINNIAVFGQKKKEVSDTITESSPETNAAACTVNIIEQRCILFDPEVRKLINESSGTFLSSKNVPSSIYDERSYYLSLSHEHRSSIRQCIENLQLKEETVPDYKEWIEMFDNIEVVWHLCELLHMDTLIGGHVVGPLVEWVRFHCCEIELRASSLMEQNAQISSSEDYWDVATGLLLQARFEATRAVLKLHSLSYTTPFLEADNILVNIPIFAADCGLSINEFISKWRSWKSSVKSKINSGIFAQHPKLLEIMEIVAGESGNLLKKLKVYCDTWYQLLSASLVFLDPTARLTDLPYYARLCIAEYGGPQAMKLLDHTIHAILEADLNKVISKLQLCADGGWSAVHLANVLQLFGAFSLSNENNQPCFEVGSLIIDYAVLLCSDYGLWTTGVSYLEQCGHTGRSTLSTLLGALPLDSEQKAYRIIDIAIRNKLIETMKSVSRWMVNKYLSCNSLNQALQWAMESDDPELMSQVADAYLRNLSSELTYSTQSLLYLGSSTNPSERLTFLAQYAKYNDLLLKKQNKEASNLFVSLIDVKVIPKFFYGRLLNDVISLLSMDDAKEIIDSNQALVILEAVEELSSDSQIPNEQIMTCREALALHLGSTLISDLTISNHNTDIICLSKFI